MPIKLLLRAAALAAAAFVLNTGPARPAAAATAPAFAPTRFTVEVVGKGRDVILIPGLATPRGVWDANVAALKGRYRLHLVEVNGFGAAPAGANAAGPVLAPLVEELAAYIKASGLDRPVVVGHSLGGLAALMLADRHPEAVGRLMAVDALPYVGTIFLPNATVEIMKPQATAMRDRMLAAYAANPGTPMPEASARANAATMAATPDAIARVANWSAHADARAVGNYLYDDMITDLRPELAKIETPITLVYPWEQDETGTASFYRAAYAGAPHVTLVPIAHAKHFVMLDQPAAFEAALESFLAD